MGPQYNKSRCNWEEFLQWVELHEGDEEAAQRLWQWLIEDKKRRQKPGLPTSGDFLTWGHLLEVADEGDQPISMTLEDWRLLKMATASITHVD